MACHGMMFSERVPQYWLLWPNYIIIVVIIMGANFFAESGWGGRLRDKKLGNEKMCVLHHFLPNVHLIMQHLNIGLSKIIKLG